MKTDKEQYSAPILTEVSFRVEQGYTLSAQHTLFGGAPYDDAVEEFSTKDGWGSGGDNHFFD